VTRETAAASLLSCRAPISFKDYVKINEQKAMPSLKAVRMQKRKERCVMFVVRDPYPRRPDEADLIAWLKDIFIMW
jgi:hypothetical protein